MKEVNNANKKDEAKTAKAEKEYHKLRLCLKM